MRNDKWIDNLKGGDRVIIKHSMFGNKIEYVYKVTKNIVILEDGSRYKKSNGHISGNSVCFDSEIVEVDDAIELNYNCNVF